MIVLFLVSEIFPLEDLQRFEAANETSVKKKIVL